MNNGIEQNLRQKIASVCLFCQCYKNTGTQGTMGPIIGCRPWGGGELSAVASCRTANFKSFYTPTTAKSSTFKLTSSNCKLLNKFKFFIVRILIKMTKPKQV